MIDLLKFIHNEARRRGKGFLIFTGLIALLGTILSPDETNPLLDFVYVWFVIICLFIGSLFIGIFIGALKNPNDTYNEAKSLIKHKHLNKSDEEPILDQVSKLNQLMGTNGTEKDIDPNGYGIFGLEATNPIPVAGVLGSLKYLKDLKTVSGNDIQYKRRGSTTSPNINGLIDIYELSMNDVVIASIYLSPYNNKNSIYPPQGFILLSQ